MTVHQMLSNMPAQELATWKAYFVIKAEKQKDQEMANASESGAQTRRWGR